MNAPRTDRVLTCYRLGDPDSAFPIFDAEGARLYPGRWNTHTSPIIYTSEHYSTAMLEKLVHTNLVMPANQIITGNVNNWQWVPNSAGFSLPAPGTLGNLQRDFLWGPGIVNFDYSVVKDTPIKEQMHLQFRAEFFNLANHSNYNLIGRIVNDPTYGIVQNQLSPRQIQFAVKLSF